MSDEDWVPSAPEILQQAIKAFQETEILLAQLRSITGDPPGPVEYADGPRVQTDPIWIQVIRNRAAAGWLATLNP